MKAISNMYPRDSVFVYVYMCISCACLRMYVHICEQVYVLMHMEARGQTPVLFFRNCPPLFLRQQLSLAGLAKQARLAVQ